jgi:hypothetical protein
MEEYGKEHPETLQLQEVEIGKNYALVISTNSGLWRYLIGDTIRFTSINPLSNLDSSPFLSLDQLSVLTSVYSPVYLFVILTASYPNPICSILNISLSVPLNIPFNLGTKSSSSASKSSALIPFVIIDA